MRYSTLTDAQRAELEQVRRQAVGRVALCAQLVLLSDRGRRVPQIAAIHGCGCDVVRTWRHRYRDRGVAAHRRILSPADDDRGADLRALTRHLLRELEKDKGQALHWVAVEHRNTDNPHVHVLLCGAGERDGEPRQVRLARGDFHRLREGGREHCREQAHERDYLDRALDHALDRDTPDRDRDHDRHDGRQAPRKPARERTIDRDDDWTP